MDVRPLSDRVLVRRDRPEGASRGGIVLPERSRKKALAGTVLAVGPGRLKDGVRLPMPVKAGDHVYFGEHCGSVVGNVLRDPSSADLVMLRAGDILAIRVE